MPVDDPADLAAGQRELAKRVERLMSGTGGGDSDHAGSGDGSVQLGPGASASGMDSSAFGGGAYATDQRSTALGWNSYAGNYFSTAVGYNANTTADYQVMLGTPSDTVVVPGTFSNPSARRLKRDIIPAPSLRDIFPELVEYEYIDGDGRRRVGYIADDLVGTDAERFVTFDNDGEPNGIDYLSLVVAQVVALRARVAELEGS